MTLRKMLSMVALAGGLFVFCAPTVAAAKPQSGVLPGTGTILTWRDGPFTANDTRTLIWRVSRAGKKKQHMNMEKAVMTRNGILIKGRACGRDDGWLNFFEKARGNVVGGRLCNGKKSFQKRPGYNQTRYSTLLSYLSEQMFEYAEIDDMGVGTPLLIRSNGHRALFLFAIPAGDLPSDAIRAVRFTGKDISIERF